MTNHQAPSTSQAQIQRNPHAKPFSIFFFLCFIVSALCTIASIASFYEVMMVDDLTDTYKMTCTKLLPSGKDGKVLRDHPFCQESEENRLKKTMEMFQGWLFYFLSPFATFSWLSASCIFFAVANQFWRHQTLHLLSKTFWDWNEGFWAIWFFWNAFFSVLGPVILSVWTDSFLTLAPFHLFLWHYKAVGFATASFWFAISYCLLIGSWFWTRIGYVVFHFTWSIVSPLIIPIFLTLFLVGIVTFIVVFFKQNMSHEPEVAHLGKSAAKALCLGQGKHEEDQL